MELKDKIREILDSKMNVYDKLIDIEKCLSKRVVIDSNEKLMEYFSQNAKVIKNPDGSITIDGSQCPGVIYIDIPCLKNKDDIYYVGCGCTWGEDLDGNRYWKLYNSKFIPRGWGSNGEYDNLKKGDIVNKNEREKREQHGK